MSTFVDMFHVERQRMSECRIEVFVHYGLMNTYGLLSTFLSGINAQQEPAGRQQK
jgi:hypothetical protein